MRTRLIRILLVGAVAAGLVACSGEAPEVGKSTHALNVTVATTTPSTAGLTVNQPAKVAPVYMIRLDGEPVLSYTGKKKNLKATKPANGKHLDKNSSAVKKYVAFLKAEQDKVLGAAGALGGKLYNYSYTLHGVSAVLTQAQVKQIASMPNVVAVTRDVFRKLNTDTSPAFLGLNDQGGLWGAAGGPADAGEDVIIGVVDTGIWPEHPSFSDQKDLVFRPGNSGKRTRVYGAPPAHWRGTCQSGEQFSQDHCNNKLIGARYYLLGAGHQGVMKNEFLSARDADGHGSHTSSTAGGNHGVEASVLGNNLGAVSGMAPRARIAMYKACWTFKDGAGCYGSDLAAAIDDAVADGVDVINYSIGGDATALNTADALAFLYAENAGVFVATSAGNSGPGASTIGNPAVIPWVTTVGANTHNRVFSGSATLGNSAVYTGASITKGSAGLSLVDSATVGSELCYPGMLDVTKVAGKIVLCKRGDIARVDKGLAVAMAGGAGLILYNEASGMATIADLHSVPAVHVTNAAGLLIKAYITSEGSSATAQLSGGSAAATQGKVMAAFSSRGPNGGSADILKPDVTAPGVNILAAYTPKAMMGAKGQLFTPMSGTSMSSPHVAGIGAMLKQLHPDWTPAMIKSALMTTATQDVFKENGTTAADAFDMGAGHIAPNTALDPGLVFPAGFYDYLAFLCGASDAVSPANCAALKSMGYSHDPSELNLASIAIGDLAGQETVARTVVNVGTTTASYAATVQASGLQVTVNPSTLNLAPGQKGSFTVTFTRTTAALDQYAFGAVTWSDGAHNVRMPFAVKPVKLAAPAAVAGSGVAGSLSYNMTFGYTGTFAAQPWGLAAALKVPGNVVDDPANDVNTALGSGVGITDHYLQLPSGAAFARFSLFDADTDGDDDLDLYVWGPYNFSTGQWPFVGSSGSYTSAEQVHVDNPAGGIYVVTVHGWGTDGADANYTLFSWAVGPGAYGNMTVSAPSAATTGGTCSVQANWEGLAPDNRYLGAVSYFDGSSTYDKTIVSISTK
jgi:hypothetical protein